MTMKTTGIFKGVITLAMMLIAVSAQAQCERDNTAFKAGESLTYDLYFNWKFIWVKAGTATYKISKSRYAGNDALRTDLLFQSNKRCSSVFPMKDTLVSYTTQELVPLYFRKGALEGKRYTVDEVWYSYSGGMCNLKQKFLDKRGKIHNTTHSSSECNYDMLSILNVARSFDASNYKKGHRIHFPMATGKKVEEQVLVYKGKEEFEANDGVTYRCLVFTLLDYEEKKKEKELLRFYITDDANHLPVRIDFFLKFGTAKAFYVSGKGLRNKQTSIIEED
jgi:hypothetical protein